MGWLDYSATDLAADDSLPTAVALWLREMHLGAMQIPLQIEIAEVNTNSATWTTLATFEMELGDYGGAVYVYWLPEIKTDAGAQGDIRVSINGGNDGTTVSTTSVAYETPSTGSKVLTVAGDENTEVTLNFQAQVAGGDVVRFRSLDRACIWVASS